MDFISSISLRGAQGTSNLSLTKFYFKPHIQAMKREFDEVKAMGSATAEEWVKGLETNGKEKLTDAARWEQWENSGGLKALRNSRHRQAEGYSYDSSLNHQIKGSSIDASSNSPNRLNNGRAENNDNGLDSSSLHGKHSKIYS